MADLRYHWNLFEVVVLCNGADVHDHSRDCDISAFQVSVSSQSIIQKICTLEAVF